MSEDDNEIIVPAKKKRKRTIIPPDHVEQLERLFNEEPWPNRTKKEILARQLSQTEHFVSVWFQNRRARFKKEELAKHQPVTNPCPSTIKPFISMINTDNIYKDSSSKQNTGIPGSTNERRPEVTIPLHSTTTVSISNPYFQNANSVIERAKDILSTCQSKIDKDKPIACSSNRKVMKILVKPRPDEKKYIYDPSTNSFTPLIKNVSKTQQISIIPLTNNSNSQREETFQTNQSQGSPTCAKVIKLVQKEGTKDLNHGCEKNEDLQKRSEKPPHLPNSEKTRLDLYSCSSDQEPISKEKQIKFFQAIISMICVAEGGIIDPSDPEYDTALNDALYGMIVNETTKLVYDTKSGLRFVPLQRC